MLTQPPLPLSFLQKSMLAQEAAADRPIYNMRLCFKITGPVEPRILEEALGQVVRRHAVLGCHYRPAGAEPCPGSSKPELITRTSVPGGEVDLIRAALWAPLFDLASQIPIRAMFVSTSPAEHYLGLCVHHVAGDSWSLRLLLEELGDNYGRLLQNQPCGNDSMAPSYFEHARSERMTTEGVAWWRERLAGIASQPYPNTETSADITSADRISVDLGLDIVASRAVRELARSARVSPAVVLFTAVSAVAAQARGQDDAVVGLLVALRDTPKLQMTLGPLLNTLPVRVSRPVSCSSLELIRAHENAINMALRHKRVPYSRILKACVTERPARAAPLFLHMVNVDNEALRLRLRGARCVRIPTPAQWAVFPAVWEFSWRSIGNVSGELRVSADAFTFDQASEIAGRFRSKLLHLPPGS